MMRTFLISLGLLMISVLTGLWVGPHFVDWSDHRAAFSKALGDFTRRNIQVNGSLVVRVLPTPAVQVTDVVIGRFIEPSAGENVAENVADKTDHSEDSQLLSFDTLTMTLELGSLLKGELRAKAVQVDRPVLRLVQEGSRNANWRTDFNPDSGLAFFDEFVVEHMQVSGGTIEILSETGEPFVINDIDARIQVGSLLGPYTATGQFSQDEAQLHDTNFSFALGTIEEGVSALSMNVGLADDSAEGTFRGNVELTDEQTKLSGDVIVSAKAEATELLTGIGSPPEWEGEEFLLRAKLSHDPSATSVTEINWSMPWGTVRGDVVYDRDERSFAAEFSSLRLRSIDSASGTSEDANASNMSAQEADVAGDTNVGSNSDAVDDGQNASKGGSWRGGPLQLLAMGYQSAITLHDSQIMGTIKFDAVSVSGGTERISDLVVDAELTEQTIELHQLSARLPGNSIAEFSGAFVRDEHDDRLWRGKISGNSQQPVTLANWISPAAYGVLEPFSINNIRELDYALDVEWSKIAFHAPAIRFKQGNQEVNGQVSVIFGDSPTLTADLTASYLEWGSVARNESDDDSQDDVALAEVSQSDASKQPLPPRLRRLIDSNTVQDNDTPTDSAAVTKDTSNASTNSVVSAPEQVANRLSEVFSGVRSWFGDVPTRVSLSSDDVKLGDVAVGRLRMVTNLDDGILNLEQLTIRGRGGLAVQASGEIVVDADDLTFRAQATATGSESVGAADLLELVGVEESIVAEVDSAPERGIAPFSILGTWQHDMKSPSRVSAAGTVGGAEFTYSVVDGETGSQVESDNREQVVTLSHSDLKQWLENWEVVPPENLPSEQKIDVRLSLAPKQEQSRQFVAEVKTGETHASLTALGHWVEGSAIVPTSFSGDFAARGDDPRWWMRVATPGLGAHLGDTAAGVELPYRGSCIVSMGDGVLSGSECVARVSSSRASGEFAYVYADNESSSTAVDRLEFDIEMDRFSLIPLLFAEDSEGSDDLQEQFRQILDKSVISRSSQISKSDATSGAETNDFDAIDAGNGLIWRSNNLHGSFPTDFEAVGNVRISSLALAPRTEMTDFDFGFQLLDGRVELSDIRAGWRGNPVQGEARLDLVDGLMWADATLRIAATLPYRLEAKTLDGSDAAFQSHLNASGNISVRGRSISEMVKNTSGEGRLRLNNASIEGIAIDSVEKGYFSSVRSSNVAGLLGEKIFVSDKTNIGDIVGNWSASDGRFRFSAPGDNELVERISMDYALPDLRRKVVVSFVVDGGDLPPYALEMRDVGPSLSEDPMPMFASADLSKIRQQLMIEITENSVFDLESLAEINDDPGSGEQMEQVRKPTGIGSVSVETLDDSFSDQ